MYKNNLFGVLNENRYFHEHFLGLGDVLSGGNDTEVSSSTNINKKMDLKTNINRSFVVKSIEKLINNVVNDVAQKNSAEVQNMVASSNTIMLNGIDCDVVNFSDIDQTSIAASSTSSTVHQTLKNTIKTNITNSITKKISNSLPNDLDDIQNKENEMMKQFMDATPGLDMNAAKNLLGGVSKNGFGNDTKINTSYNLNAELKKTLNLDESFKVDDNDEVGNGLTVTDDNPVNSAGPATQAVSLSAVTV